MVSEEVLKQGLTKTLDDPSLDGYGEPQKGKVRNSYVKDGKRYIVTSDRISAFERVLGTIPYKGQVLNRVAAFWFQKTADMVPNHLTSPMESRLRPHVGISQRVSRLRVNHLSPTPMCPTTVSPKTWHCSWHR